MDIRRRWIWLLLPACALALAIFSRTAKGEDDSADAVPSGTVAFFSGTAGACPQGWRVADETTGRLIVAGGDSVGKLVGVPLANEEDRTHAHSFSASVNLPYKALSALDGNNNQGAAAQTYTDSGMSKPATTGLPFIQLVACVKS